MSIYIIFCGVGRSGGGFNALCDIIIKHREPSSSGMDLGFLEWWGCNSNVCEARAKKFRPRPLNYNHTYFNCLVLPTELCPAGTPTSVKPQAAPQLV